MTRDTIIFIANDFTWKSGIGKTASDNLLSLLLLNKSITVISEFRQKYFLHAHKLESYELSNLKWVRIPKKLSFPRELNRRFVRNILRLFYRAFNNIFCLRYSKHIKRLKYKLVIVNSLGGHELMKRCNINLQEHSVMIMHGSKATFESEYTEHNLNQVLEYLSTHNYLIFVSSIIQNEWLSFDVLKNKRSFYIPNCADEDKINKLIVKDKTEIRDKLNFDCKKFTVVCVANLQYGKGQDLLVDNIELIRRNISNIEIFFIGLKIFPWGHELVRKIKRLGFNELKYLDSKLDALSYIYAADVLILPTRAEAMPLVILEAMALSTPIIASRVGGIPELIENGKSGILIDINNIHQIITALKSTYNNEIKTKYLVKNANRRYWSIFSRAHQIKSYAKTINSILDEH